MGVFNKIISTILYKILLFMVHIVGFCPLFMLWDSVLWDFVLWDFVHRDFVLWDSVLWDSVPDYSFYILSFRSHCIIKIPEHAPGIF